ncbi:MAG: hypothetical protein CMJ18_09675 [Phycisphaeraceae bacterium]|nr:hypothetical protein [Phycisphaeraceae bacterium]
MSTRTPNILYLHCHDAGRYLQPYGYAIPTPAIQALAEQGTLFRQAFSAAPTCSPNRACLLTGQWAHSNGMMGLSHRGFTLADYSRHIVHTLHDAGYVAARSGLQHVARQPFADPAALGYDHVLTEDESFGAVTAHAERFLDADQGASHQMDCLFVAFRGFESAPTGCTPMPRRPHILFILTDQLRADCTGSAGHPALRTPNIDWIASRGVRFTNAFKKDPCDDSDIKTYSRPGRGSSRARMRSCRSTGHRASAAGTARPEQFRDGGAACPRPEGRRDAPFQHRQPAKRLAVVQNPRAGGSAWRNPLVDQPGGRG